MVNGSKLIILPTAIEHYPQMCITSSLCEEISGYNLAFLQSGGMGTSAMFWGHLHDVRRQLSAVDHGGKGRWECITRPTAWAFSGGSPPLTDSGH